MFAPIVDIAGARNVSHKEAEEFCRAVFRHFLGTLPKYEVLARVVMDAPTATPAETARRLAQGLANGSLPRPAPPELQPGEPPAWPFDDSKWPGLFAALPKFRYQSPGYANAETLPIRRPHPSAFDGAARQNAKPYDGRQRVSRQDTGQVRRPPEAPTPDNTPPKVGSGKQSKGLSPRELRGTEIVGCPHGKRRREFCAICDPDGYVANFGDWTKD